MEHTLPSHTYGISLVVPTLNEAENISLLLARIDTALRGVAAYEVIIIDDHSKDDIETIVTKLSAIYPVQFHTKKGKRGKAYSLLEGFSHGSYDVVGFIDADLQYPPEALVTMLEKISHGFDVVVASRATDDISFVRRTFSKTFAYVFGFLLHGLSYDIQSGCKIFRREVLRRFRISPRPWTFDLEFLLKSRHAGYKIASVPIHFNKRNAGKTKVKLLSTTIEIGMSAIAMKLKNFAPIPFLPERAAKEGKGFHHKGQKFVHHSNLLVHDMAFSRLSGYQNLLLTVFLAFLFFAIIINWYITLLISLILLTSLYFLDIFFNFFLIFHSFKTYPEITISHDELKEVRDTDWPTYTIFCPLYKEWHVVPQFVTAMSRLDYPKDKLQVMLLLEEDDHETQEKITTFDLPKYFTVVVVPDSQPKTKPKACNYGLKTATGEYSVIYDAEDVPDPDQLKKAVLAFRKSDEKVACMQAKLNFYNSHHNLLTRLFTAEYTLWFDLILTGLQSIQAPIPLGGTSNHFRTASLHELGGWDAFNVTEDCDLGMRLVKQGYKTAIFDSTTMEEANSAFFNWFGQRSRWIKGYIQSYFVHMRNPSLFRRNFKNPDLFTFQLIVGGKVLSMLVNPLLWIMTIAYFGFRSTFGTFIESLFPGPLLYVGVFSAVVGNFLYIYYYMIGSAKKGHFDLIIYGLFIPVYWLMMSVATLIASYKIIVDPHYWFKTQHGLHLKSEGANTQAEAVVGQNLVDHKLTNLAFS